MKLSNVLVVGLVILGVLFVRQSVLSSNFSAPPSLGITVGACGGDRTKPATYCIKSGSVPYQKTRTVVYDRVTGKDDDGKFITEKKEIQGAMVLLIVFHQICA